MQQRSEPRSCAAAVIGEASLSSLSSAILLYFGRSAAPLSPATAERERVEVNGTLGLPYPYALQKAAREDPMKRRVWVGLGWRACCKTQGVRAEARKRQTFPSSDRCLTDAMHPDQADERAHGQLSPQSERACVCV